MSAEKSQAPSRLRRQQARDAGHAPHSPELTAAAGLLAAFVLLGAWAGELGHTLLRILVSRITSAEPVGPREPVGISAQFLESAAPLTVPLGSILFGTLVAMVATHQVQTGGLWAPGRLVPDLSRLWRGLTETDEELSLAKPFLNGVTALMKVVILASVAIWVVWAQIPRLADLCRLSTYALLPAAANLISTVGLALAVSGAMVGLADFAFKFRQFEEHLRLTPEQQREEQKAIDGDPAIRSRRVQTARAWIKDPGDILTGAALLLTGSGGLSILIAGSPPPGKISVRTIARGAAASSLRRAATKAGIPVEHAPVLSRWFADSRAQRGPLPPELATELASLWPVPSLLKHH